MTEKLIGYENGLPVYEDDEFQKTYDRIQLHKMLREMEEK